MLYFPDIYNLNISLTSQHIIHKDTNSLFLPPSVDDILCLNLSSWMNSKVTRTVTLTKQNQKRLWKNLTKRSGRQIKASMRFNL